MGCGLSLHCRTTSLPTTTSVRFSREPECSNTNEYADLLESQLDTAKKIIQSFKWSVLLTLNVNLFCYSFFETLNMNESHVNVCYCDRRMIFAVVHARCVDRSAAHPCFVKIKFRLIEAAKIVDHAHQ